MNSSIITLILLGSVIIINQSDTKSAFEEQLMNGAVADNEDFPREKRATYISN